MIRSIYFSKLFSHTHKVGLIKNIRLDKWLRELVGKLLYHPHRQRARRISQFTFYIRHTRMGFRTNGPQVSIVGQDLYISQGYIETFLVWGSQRGFISSGNGQIKGNIVNNHYVLAVAPIYSEPRVFQIIGRDILVMCLWRYFQKVWSLVQLNQLISILFRRWTQ